MINNLLVLEETNYLIPLLIGVSISIVIGLSYFYSDKNRILRELKKSRRKQISQVREKEYAKIIGKAKHVNEPLIAPLSGRKCVYYKVHIERKGNKSWHTVVEETKSQDFFLESNTELAIVKASFGTENNKRVHLVQDHERSSGFLNDASHKLNDYLAKHNKSSTNLLGLNKTMRYKEGIIALNETVAVKGIAKWKALNQPIDGYSYSRVLTLEGSSEQKLLITDAPKALEEAPRKL